MLRHTDLRFTHTKHILPIVNHILDHIPVIMYQPELKIGHDCIRCQCLPETFIANARSFRYGDDVFIVSLQRQIFNFLSYLSGFCEIHAVKSGFTITNLSLHNQANSILAARSSVLPHTAGIHCSRCFECINLPVVGCASIHGIKNCLPFPHLLATVSRKVRSIRSRIDNLSGCIPCRSNISYGIVIGQINFLYCEVRCRITNINTRQHAFHIDAGYRVHRRSYFRYFLFTVHRNPCVTTSRRTVCRPFAGVGMEQCFHRLNFSGFPLLEFRRNTVKFPICHNHDACRFGSGIKYGREIHSRVIICQILCNSRATNPFQKYHRCF